MLLPSMLNVILLHSVHGYLTYNKINILLCNILLVRCFLFAGSPALTPASLEKRWILERLCTSPGGGGSSLTTTTSEHG